MQFTVPKFLDREAKIAFGLTFKKLAIMGGLGLILFFLYYTVPRFIFGLALFVFAGGFLVASFVKIKGQSIPYLVANAFGFIVSPKTYVWDKKRPFSSIRLTKKIEKIEEKKEEPLRMAPKSQLGSIGSRIEMGSKNNFEE